MLLNMFSSKFQIEYTIIINILSETQRNYHTNNVHKSDNNSNINSDQKTGHQNFNNIFKSS